MTILSRLLERTRKREASQNSSPASPASPSDADHLLAAIATIRRLKFYTMPAGRMDAAREIVSRLEQHRNPPHSPESQRSELNHIEAELIAALMIMNLPMLSDASMRFFQMPAL
jgi:hypothetical protein